MARPFRFGLHVWELPLPDWSSRAQRYEALGFSSITFTDHLVVPQWEPFTALAAVAGVTRRIRVGTLVADNGLRNPVLTAKAAATLDRLSGGRLDLGLGAGYVAANFAAAGLPFARTSERLAQLEESIALMRRLWCDETTTFAGRFYQVTDSPRVAPEPVSPALLVDGDRPRAMRLAGRVADIASMIPRQDTGQWSIPASLADSTLARMAEKADWVRAGAAAAGRDPASIELNTMVFRVAVGPDAPARLDALARADGVAPRGRARLDTLPRGRGRPRARPAARLPGSRRDHLRLALRSGGRPARVPGRARHRPARVRVGARPRTVSRKSVDQLGC